MKKAKNERIKMGQSHTVTLPRLNRAQGQLEAVKKMIEAHEYCPNIIQQLRASISALRALEATILQNHLEHCVQDAMTSKDKEEVKAKVDELIRLFKK